MNRKIKFNTIMLFLVVSLLACTSKKEEKTTKQDAEATSTQSNLNESDCVLYNVTPSSTDPATSIYDVVEQTPQFPGGDKKLIEFISKNIHYPLIAQENGIQGRVIVRFVVTRTGKVDKCEVLRSLNPGCDREALRVIRLLPQWIPGKQNGENVSVWYTIPINFKLR